MGRNHEKFGNHRNNKRPWSKPQYGLTYII